MTDNVGMHPGASASPSRDIPAHNVGMHPGASDAPSRDIPTYTRQSLPQRKNIRAEFNDYSCGDYFVTICTRDKRHYLGKIINREITLTPIGKYADEAMKELATHYNYVELPLYVVMPNHVHAIIRICQKADAPGCIPTIRTALGVVVGGYKQSVTRFARRNNIEFGWQSRYHDHIIRSIYDGNKISDYIESNVDKWSSDCYNTTE